MITSGDCLAINAMIVGLTLIVMIAAALESKSHLLNNGG